MITTRRLAPEDWRENRAIRLEALAEFPGNYFTTLAEVEKRSEADWHAMLVDPKMAIFGLFDGEQLAGLTAIYVSDVDPSGRTAGFEHPLTQGHRTQRLHPHRRHPLSLARWSGGRQCRV